MAVPTRSIYVGNIPYAATPESLMEAFADYEPVSVKIVEGRGFAFVEVPARRAYGMVKDTDGSKLEGRMLSVSVARTRENEPTLTQDQARPPQDYNRPESRPENRPDNRPDKRTDRAPNPFGPRGSYGSNSRTDNLPPIHREPNQDHSQPPPPKTRRTFKEP
jgi:RNA recognition motif-containing protein